MSCMFCDTLHNFHKHYLDPISIQDFVQRDAFDPFLLLESTHYYIVHTLFERSEFLIDTPHKRNLRVCPRARVN